jgi:hypothetical protein
MRWCSLASKGQHFFSWQGQSFCPWPQETKSISEEFI